MKCALICTTINVPTVLELYRQHGPDVRFFVTGDKKTPQAAYDFCDAIPNCVAGRETSQIGWKCSELIDWNCIQRRNIALLEAIKWGADIIVSVDTDDFPTMPDHFEQIENALAQPFNGLELRANSGWVDPGSLIEPPTSHRGMPVRLDRFYVHPAINRKVGVVASTVLGSCDLAAIDRLVGTPKRSVASELARSGVIVDPACNWTIFNSEAVAYCRELAPAMMVLSFVGRFDDLFASLICQRIMKDSGYVTRLGPPAVWHEREDRDILKDLQGEVWGMSHIEGFAAFLEDVAFIADDTIAQRVRGIYKSAERNKVLPPQTIEAALAFLDDMESIL
jgi:hypothetical protein